MDGETRPSQPAATPTRSARQRALDGALREAAGLLRAMAGLEGPHLLATDLSMPQFRLLVTVWEAGGLRSGHLAARLGVGAPTVTSLVDRLAAQGYVRREPGDRDRRVTEVRTTAAGAAAVEELLLAERARFTALLRGLSHEELALVHRAFSLLAAGARAAAGVSIRA